MNGHQIFGEQPPPPAGTAHGSDRPPYEKIEPIHSLDELVYPEHINAEILSLLEDFEFEKELKAAAIPVRRTLLMSGSPGCGKTALAHALAKKLNFPLYYVSVADSLSSYMGDSEKNLRTAMEFAQYNTCVLLLDEFDSLASKRLQADRAGATENNRIVNTLLVCFDQKQPRGLTIACTNFLSSIDAAILRRFELALEIPDATEPTLRRIAEKVLGSRLDPDVETVLRAHKTPAEVTKACKQVLRARVIAAAKRKKIELPGEQAGARIKELSGVRR